MQVTSALHKALLRDDRHQKEHKAVIAGVTYLQPDILSLRTSGEAFAEPDIGNCASLLLRFGDIPAETWYLVDEFGDAITFGGDRIVVR